MGKKYLIRKAAKYLSDDNPNYIQDKEKLLKILQGSAPKIPDLFYDVEAKLKSKRLRDDVLRFATLYANKQLNRLEVLKLIEYEPKRRFKPSKPWIVKKK